MSEQEARLRRNVAVQEAADAFVGARSQMMLLAKQEEDVGRQARVTQGAETTKPTRGSKRKRTQEDGDVPITQAPRTRSQRQAERARSVSDLAAKNHTTDRSLPVDTDIEDGDYEPYQDDYQQEDTRNAQNSHTPQPSDGLVACPMCGKRMKEELVFPHTDTCTGNSSRSSPPPRPSSSSSKNTLHDPSKPLREARPPPERLPQINYSLLRDQALKKKLSDQGIPSWGPRSLLIRRHNEWLALWNANCDSKFPRNKRELLGELDKWERSQGGCTPANSSAGSRGWPSGADRSGDRGFTTAANIMQKDFNAERWSNDNREDFKDLIKKARERKEIRPENKSQDNPGSNANPPQDESVRPSPNEGYTLPVVNGNDFHDDEGGQRDDQMDVDRTQDEHSMNVQKERSGKPPNVAQDSSSSTVVKPSGSVLSWIPGNDAMNISLAAARRASNHDLSAPSHGETPSNLFSSSSEMSPIKQKPMFELPAEPVLDSEIGGAR